MSKMKGEARRAHILQHLSNSSSAISASQLGKELSVSRQVIVGDVALLRALGHEIMATGRGYLLEKSATGFVGQIPCLHQKEQTQEELEIIISHQGMVKDVLVEHPIYGELRGNLYLKTLEEVKEFMAKINQHPQLLLSSLTSGVHWHTVEAPSKKEFQEIKQALKKAGILYSE